MLMLAQQKMSLSKIVEDTIVRQQVRVLDKQNINIKA